MGLILASNSRSRKKMLEAAGIRFKTVVSGVNEAKIKSEMMATGADFVEMTERLAQKKANAVSQRYNGDLVIGADQILVCENIAFDKAKTIEEARKNLMFLRGKKHSLVTSVVLAKDKKIIWTYTEQPRLSMINFSDGFLENYMQNAGDALLHSVGSYFLEEYGITLFSEIDGSYHTILGMPLIPLLQKLRELNKADG